MRGRLIHRSAWKRHSRKFAVASDPTDAAASTRKRPDGTPQASKRGDYVLLVAQTCIKELRLVTAQLPEKYSPLGPGPRRTSPTAFTIMIELASGSHSARRSHERPWR